jgi:hypothetical protein
MSYTPAQPVSQARHRNVHCRQAPAYHKEHREGCHTSYTCSEPAETGRDACNGLRGDIFLAPSLNPFAATLGNRSVFDSLQLPVGTQFTSPQW